MSTQYDDIISGASNDFGVPFDLVKSVIKVESGFKQSAVGTSGEKGLMQLMPGTAGDLGVSNPFDPEQNIRAGTKYLAQKFKETGNWRDALAKYNGGKYFKGSQAQGYADKVIGVYGGDPDTAVIEDKVVDQVKRVSEDSDTWYYRIWDSIKNFFIDNGIKVILLLLAVLVIVFGIYKLINS